MSGKKLLIVGYGGAGSKVCAIIAKMKVSDHDYEEWGSYAYIIRFFS